MWILIVVASVGVRRSLTIGRWQSHRCGCGCGNALVDDVVLPVIILRVRSASLVGCASLRIYGWLGAVNALAEIVGIGLGVLATVA